MECNGHAAVAKQRISGPPFTFPLFSLERNGVLITKQWRAGRRSTISSLGTRNRNSHCEHHACNVNERLRATQHFFTDVKCVGEYPGPNLHAVVAIREDDQSTLRLGKQNHDSVNTRIA